jgi:hypothetical protein
VRRQNDCCAAALQHSKKKLAGMTLGNNEAQAVLIRAQASVNICPSVTLMIY